MSNINTLKKQMLIIKSFDWFLIFLVLGVALPCIFLTDYKIIAGIITALGLGFLGTFSTWSLHKIAAIKAEVAKLEREQKKHRR